MASKMPFGSLTPAGRLGDPELKRATGAGAGGSKIRTLSRQWSGTVGTSQVAPARVPQTSQPTWEVGQEEWPSSPPHKRAKSATALNLGIGAGGWRNNGGTRDSGAGLPGGLPPPSQSGFAAASGRAFGDRPSTSRPAPFISTSALSATSSHKSESAVISKQGKKREYPWDHAAFKHERKVSDASSGGGAFHKLAAHPGQKVKVNVPGSKDLLSNATMSIASKVTLSPEQRAVLSLVLSGQSVFFTGSAGTGKSVLLRQIIRDLRDKYISRGDAVAVTASTGMAACNVGGTTIHSFAGIGLGHEPAEALRNKVMKNRKAAGRWKRTKVIVIDEVSMVDGDLFDKLEYIGRKLKGSEKPFGGIQVVVTGDFFQLPPVSKGKVTFAFDAKTWSKCIPHMVNLTQVFRQSDTTFIDMLNEMRMGQLSQKSVERFKALSREPRYSDGIDPTELYPVRTEVVRSNEGRLRALTGAEQTFFAIDSGKASDEQKSRDFNNMMAVDKLVLKVDAQVMMIKNMTDEGLPWLVNGAVGKVVDFCDDQLSIVEWKDLTFGGSDASEAVGLDGKLRKGHKSKKSTGGGDGSRSYPVVKWFLANGQEDYTIVLPADFKVENAEGEIMSKRIQLPLILAWAMSIHKSQGQTLNRVKVDLGRVFEKGQSYVALSRATSMEGLQVLNFDKNKVNAHPAVVQWSRENLKSAL